MSANTEPKATPESISEAAWQMLWHAQAEMMSIFSRILMEDDDREQWDRIKQLEPVARMYRHIRHVTREALMVAMPARIYMESAEELISARRAGVDTTGMRPIDSKEIFRSLDGNERTRGFQASAITRTEIKRRCGKDTTIIEFAGSQGLSIAIELDADAMLDLRKAVGT